MNGTFNLWQIHKRTKGGCGVIPTEAIIYYPTDEKAIRQLNKEIASFHNAVALKYMDTVLKLTPRQKVKMLDSLMQDIMCNIESKKNAS